MYSARAAFAGSFALLVLVSEAPSEIRKKGSREDSARKSGDWETEQKSTYVSAGFPVSSIPRTIIFRIRGTANRN
jgi:hypothetical protein